MTPVCGVRLLEFWFEKKTITNASKPDVFLRANATQNEENPVVDKKNVRKTGKIKMTSCFCFWLVCLFLWNVSYCFTSQTFFPRSLCAMKLSTNPRLLHLETFRFHHLPRSDNKHMSVNLNQAKIQKTMEWLAEPNSSLTAVLLTPVMMFGPKK